MMMNRTVISMMDTIYAVGDGSCCMQSKDMDDEEWLLRCVDTLCIVQRRRSKRDAYICMYKEIGRKNTKYVRIVSNKKKTYKKTTSMRRVISSIPFNCIKDKSVAESIDDAMRVHELDCRSPRHTSSILT